MTEKTGEAYEGWAIVELMGHRRLAGKVSQAEQYGVAMLRLDVPGDDGETVATQFYGGSSIYCLTPTTEEMARAVALRNQPAPVQRWELPEPKPRMPELTLVTCSCTSTFRVPSTADTATCPDCGVTFEIEDDEDDEDAEIKDLPY